MVCGVLLEDAEREGEERLGGSSLVMPILWAMSMTLSWPTLVARRTNAQFTEPAVASHSVMYAVRPSARR